MREKVVRALRPLDAFSVENVVRAGTPDVNFTDGWIELKQLDKKPMRAETTVRLQHFTPQQRVFLRRRWHKGGKAFLLLLLEGEWMLFDGCWAARFVGNVNYDILAFHALGHWASGLVETELLECLTTISPADQCTCQAAIKLFRPESIIQ